jgi:hypothetical protein
VVVVAAGGDERRLITHPLLELESENAAVEVDRPLDVGDLQMHVADVDPRIDAHAQTITASKCEVDATSNAEARIADSTPTRTEDEAPSELSPAASTARIV